ncbi:MAG: hypothetical protein R3C10_22570 [Pirellulales bacterium]
MADLQPNWRPQFSLRHMVIAMAGTSVAFAILLAFPETLASLVILLAFALTTVGFICGIIYGRKDVRAFCIGGLFMATMVTVPAFFVFFAAIVDGPRRLEQAAPGMRLALVIGAISAPVAGRSCDRHARRLTRDD